MTDQIAIIGGTGPQGQGLALRFAMAGVPVALGSRDGARGAEIAAELNGKIGGNLIVGLENSAAVAE
ncbi:NADPH-dependent F420 reductase, partial [hydrothermal vent metagenome]